MKLILNQENTGVPMGVGSIGVFTDDEAYLARLSDVPGAVRKQLTDPATARIFG